MPYRLVSPDRKLYLVDNEEDLKGVGKLYGLTSKQLGNVRQLLSWTVVGNHSGDHNDRTERKEAESKEHGEEHSNAKKKEPQPCTQVSLRERAWIHCRGRKAADPRIIRGLQKNIRSTTTTTLRIGYKLCVCMCIVRPPCPKAGSRPPYDGSHTLESTNRRLEDAVYAVWIARSRRNRKK